MRRPKVTVCIPTYNRATDLAITIEAILRQTFQDWEMIVGDDGSTDSTASVVRGFDDGRIRYSPSERNQGLYNNWNRLLYMATAPFVAIYHDHDFYLPSILERSVELLERVPTASFVHTAFVLWDSRGQAVGLDVRDFPEFLTGDRMRRILSGSWYSPVMAATAMVRRAAYTKVGNYRYAQFGLGCDLDMWYRLARVGDVAYCKTPQALIRAREKGVGTAQFRWEDILGFVLMRRAGLEAGDDEARPASRLRMARYELVKDIELLRWRVRALLGDTAEVAGRGKTVLRSHASSWANHVGDLVEHSALLRDLLRRGPLRWHHRRARKVALRHQRVAADYVQRVGLDRMMDSVSRKRGGEDAT
jgi:hypothetical protein